MGRQAGSQRAKSGGGMFRFADIVHKLMQTRPSFRDPGSMGWLLVPFLNYPFVRVRSRACVVLPACERFAVTRQPCVRL